MHRGDPGTRCATDAGVHRRDFLRLAGAALALASAPRLLAAGTEASHPMARLAVPLGRLGPQLVAAGAIEPALFEAACAAARQPLDEARRRVLTEGVEALALDAPNAHFLLNLLWAAGLANRNPLLSRGPMLQAGMSQIPGYASTGGWSLGARPVMEIYGQVPLVALERGPQARLEEVAAQVYRPCCDNPTSFPDCNHGMAMLALLTLLASKGADVDALFHAAKVANGFWFPDATAQLATYVRAVHGADYHGFDPREATGRRLFSGSGSRQVAEALRRWGMAPEPSTATCSA